MKKNFVYLFFALITNVTTFGQLNGPYAIPGTLPAGYPTVQAAIADLNLQGISGGVTFNIAAGYTETFASPTAGLITATGTLANQIVFQKDPATSGSNPLITAGIGTTGTTATNGIDGIIVIAGGDYITFDGIDLAESAANADQITRMEFGYALVKGSNVAPFNGCQNVIIKNCTISMNKFLTASTFTTCTGIYSGNHLATSNVNIDISSGTLADAMNNCKFFNNNITNVTTGIWLWGYNGPLALYDQNNEIGVGGANTITNFNSYGIRVQQSRSLLIANNALTSITLPATSIYGIYTQNILGSDTYNNVVTIQPTGGNFQITGVNVIVSLASDFSGSIYGNTIQNCTNAAATSAGFTGISNSGGPGTLNFYNNIVKDNSIPGTGTFTGMSSGGSTVNLNMYGNIVINNSKTGISGSMTCLQTACSGTGNTYGNNIYANTNIISTATATQGGTLTGISITSGNPNKVFRNQVYNLLSNGGNGVVNGISSNATQSFIYNNFISDLKTPSATTTTSTKATSIAGINISGGTTVGAYYNTVYLNAPQSTGVNCYTAALLASTSPVVDLRNNILINVTTPQGAGISAAFRRNGTTYTTYSDNSGNNAFWAGDPEDGTHAIFYNGTTAYNFADYLALIGPVRDAASFRELPTFLNVSASPYDLHINPAISTLCESGGVMVSAPIAITDDYDGTPRASVPDVGADEFGGTFTGVLNPSGVFTTLISSSQVNVAFTPNPSTNNVVIVWNTTGIFTLPSGPPPSNAGDPFAGGSLLSNGTTSPVIHNNLAGATTFYYKAFSYDGTSYSNGVVVLKTTNIDPPTAFTATPISYGQINLTWTKNVFNNDVIIAYNNTGSFVQPSNGTAYPLGSLIGTATVIYQGPLAAFNQTTGLNPYTTYYYRIWSVDQANNNVYSSTGADANATTLCAPSVIPFAEGFEYGGALGCGAIFDANGDSYKWAPYYSATYAHLSTYSLRMVGSPNDDWYITNGIQLTAGVTYEVKFWYRTQSAGGVHKFEVKWGNAQNVAGMTSSPIFYNANMTGTTTYIQVTCSSFTPANTGLYFIGFRNFSTQSFNPNMFLDDISVTMTNVPAAINWTGIKSSDWFNSGNWSPVGVPGAITAVTIPAGLTTYPSVSSPASCSSILIASGASLLDNSNLTVSGTTTVERAIVGGEWHLISAPVSNAVSGMFLNKFIQKHTESTNLFSDINSVTEPLTPMKGFALWDTNGYTAQYIGPLNTGSQSIALTRTATGTDRGWNLVGNPFASSIDWNAVSGWTKTNVNNATYIHVNNATWASYVDGVGTNGGTQYIAPGQGFFIGVTDGFSSGTLAMDNSVRVNNVTPFYKDAVSNLVRLQVSGNGYTDETVVRFLPEATAAFDGNYDANKFFGDVNEAAQIYSTGSTPLAINTLPETSTVAMVVRAKTAGVYTIAATEVNDFTVVTLEDTKTGIVTDLLKGSYSFNPTPGENEQRFVVHFAPLSVTGIENTHSNIYSYANTVYVDLKDNTAGTIFIYNISGQLVASAPATPGMNKINLSTSGIYIVKLISDKRTEVKKVSIQ